MMLSQTIDSKASILDKISYSELETPHDGRDITPTNEPHQQTFNHLVWRITRKLFEAWKQTTTIEQKRILVLWHLDK